MASATANLTRQFMMMGGGLMLVAMLAAGFYVAETTSKATIENTASSTALLIDSFISPLAQSLATQDILPIEQRERLEGLLHRATLQQRFPHLEIWKQGGVVAYSTSAELIGQRFPEPDGLKAGLAGRVSAQFTDLDAKEHSIRGFDSPFLEIYIPIREHYSGRIVAVAEIHENTVQLEQKLWRLRLESWLAVAGAALFVMAGLFAIVYRGNQLIVHQQNQLQERLADIERTSQLNHLLKDRAQRASGRVVELTENYLRRIGADLHDGPSQLIGLAALTVEHVRRAQTSARREEELQGLETMLSDALHDIRTTSKGLMLPDIESLPLTEVIKRVVANHELRTGTRVSVECDNIRLAFTHAIKICVYRFAQESLNNAFRHAGGNGQKVVCRLEECVLQVAVEDDGGRGSGNPARADSGLGLIGLRDRVESLGGMLRIEARDNGGTRVEMRVVVAEEMVG